MPLFMKDLRVEYKIKHLQIIVVLRYIQNIELSICHKPFLNFELLKLSLKTQDVFQNFSLNFLSHPVTPSN